MRKSEMLYDIVALINDKVITQDDLEEFSDELKEYVQFLLDRNYGKQNTLQLLGRSIQISWMDRLFCCHLSTEKYIREKNSFSYRNEINMRRSNKKTFDCTLSAVLGQKEKGIVNVEGQKYNRLKEHMRRR